MDADPEKPQIRAPRLTEKLLTEDLPQLVSTADDEIEYLTSALAATGAGEVRGDLRRHMETKRQRLLRSRSWLAGKLAAESNHRTQEATQP